MKYLGQVILPSFGCQENTLEDFVTVTDILDHNEILYNMLNCTENFTVHCEFSLSSGAHYGSYQVNISCFVTQMLFCSVVYDGHLQTNRIEK